jgi:hypothetical protein
LNTATELSAAKWATLQAALQRPASTADELCTEIARVFRVRYDEIALLRIQGKSLKFICPFQLRQAGTIPLSSSAVAARTANTRIPELFNDFVRVQHLSVFEVMAAKAATSGSHVIQKLMTAAIIDQQEKVWGVLQVCRKGVDCAAAGPDFTLDDLHDLTLAAGSLAERMHRVL